MLQAKSRFKYKSIIQQGEMRVVSLISKKHGYHEQGVLGNYRTLAYTSKNELYVIDILNPSSKSESLQSPDLDGKIQQFTDSDDDDTMSSGRGLDKSHPKENKGFNLSIIENFELNIATSSFVKIDPQSVA